ncbi:MAG TPA: ABC transporter ATP-binding protein [Peptococcaceae bacterium]|nr:ABC transporter ATP-binding protein [Peptococcaceae bacterium]
MRNEQSSDRQLRPGRRHLRGGWALGRPKEKAKDFKGTLRRLLKYLSPYRGQIALVFTMAVLSTSFSILSPIIMGKGTTIIFEGFLLKLQGVPGAGVDFQHLGRLVFSLITLYLFSSVFSYGQQFLMAGIAQKIVFKMRQDLNVKLHVLPLRYFDSRTHGEVLSRVTNDVDTVSTTLQQSLTQLITSLVTLLGIVLMMLIISPLLTLITAGILPLSFLITAQVAKHSQKYFADQQKALGELNGHVEEMYTGHEVIKAFGRERESVQKFEEINDRLYASGWKAQFVSGIIMPLLSFINNLGYVLISVVGGIMVAKRSIEIGDIQAFLQYSRQFSHPIVQTASIANILQSTIAAAERVFEVLDEVEEAPEPKEPQVLKYPRGEVRFENISFGYQEGDVLFHNLSIVVRPGETVAIVGPTGAGKTTLVNLLLRFYDVQAGKITVDGIDIRDLSRRDLRRMFGMVLQDTWLFNGTIKDNIAYGREGVGKEDIIRAARAAHADHFIRTLPEGYETVLNEEASNLSQGQKQLITIARAILADPPILILDEATSSVDTRTEILLQKAMTKLMEGRTCFVIAHRLSTIRDADTILVMNNGKIIEQGNHRELLARGGFYAELYNSQFSTGGPADSPGQES